MRSRYVAVLGAGLLLVAAQAFAAGELECRSSGYHYQYCPANTQNSVQLAQQLSNTRCDYGRSWGYDQRGVWVDNGCAAMFTYGRGGGSGGGGHHSGGGDVVGALAAAVILGALVSSDSDHGHRSRDQGYPNRNYGNNDQGYHGGNDYGVNVPAWAVGHFAGPDRDGGPDIEIAVDPDGRIDGMQGSMIFNGQMRGTSAWIGNREYSVVRSSNGMRLMGAGRSGYDLYRQ